MIRKSILVLAIMAITSVSALAVNYYWNVASGNWSLGSNWDPAGPPASNAWAIIDNGGTATINVDFLKTAVQQVRVYDGVINQSTKNIQTQYLMLGSDGADGIYNLSGGSLDVALGDVYVGVKADAEATGGNGYFNMTGGTLGVKNLKVGYAVGAYGEFNISDGTLNVNGVLVVGNNVAMGNGIFKQTGGDVNIIGNLYISQYDSNPFGPLDGYGIYNMEGGYLEMDGSEGGEDTPEGNIYVGSEDGENAGIMKLKAGYISVVDFYITAEDSYLYDACAHSQSHVTVAVYGEFINSSTDNANFNITHTTIMMVGGGAGFNAGDHTWDKTVIDMGAVIDKGAVLTGLEHNFAIGDLIFVGAETGSIWYMLESDIYCYGLRIEAGAVVDLNGYNIYYMPEGSKSYFGSRPTTGGLEGMYGDMTGQGGNIYALTPTGFVPEPGTIVLIGAGVLGLAAVLRRKYC